MSRSWDVFCKVVDNYGDAAVSWRLAVQLASEHAGRVRLWIDAPAVLHALCPQVVPHVRIQQVSGVEVCHWTADADFGRPAEIVIEAFGGGLPDRYVAAMAASTQRPVWVILEYLSAEPWVTAHHGLPSPHPRLPLERHFFFPGFGPRTGGVLREALLDTRRKAFEASKEAVDGFWQRMGFSRPHASTTVVSLFGYENPAMAAFLSMWSQSLQKTVVAVPPGQLRAQVCAFFGVADPGDGRALSEGALEVRLVPFVAQPAYDELLWACDWNFVRGEDSFVRAQWARRPMVWQIYPQHDDAHRAKLDAFLSLYCQGLEGGVDNPYRRLWEAWNGTHAAGRQAIAEDWKAVNEQGGVLRSHCARWADGLRAQGDLARTLAQFCEERLK